MRQRGLGVFALESFTKTICGASHQLASEIFKRDQRLGGRKGSTSGAVETAFSVEEIFYMPRRA